jgi:ABC-type multidrug transport system fused ATPase/permease subunit
LGRHDLHDERFGAVNRRTLEAGLRAVELRARFTPLVEVTAALGAGALLWVGGWGALHGTWTLGVVLVAIAYVRNMLKPMRSLSKLSLTLSRAAASAERVRALFDEPGREPALARRPNLVTPVGRARGALELRDVSFDYGRGRVLGDVSLRVEAGERVALVGPNGAGKSTVLALIAGLYQPTTGAALIDGHGTDTLPVDWLRQQVAVVLQDTFLFAGTVWDNLLYGRPEATRNEVLAAAEAAFVADFATDLAGAYETVLGDHGRGLSGGQRQRIGIARALLLDAPVVLLDEPTSGLDIEAEALVVCGLRTLMERRTVVMTTHRPALLELADRVIVIDHGRLVSEASPSACVAQDLCRADGPPC